jgi:hypothetical protein
MSLDSLWTTILDWQISAAMRGELPGTEWLFPIVETLHVMALTLVFGSIAMLDLRLLGVSSQNRPMTRLTAELLPWTWTAWITAAIMGTLMFIAKADTYAGNLQFRLKFACMALAALNMLVFHLGIFRQVLRWDTSTPPLRAKIAGAVSLCSWVAVVFFGRWVGFTT